MTKLNQVRVSEEAKASFQRNHSKWNRCDARDHISVFTEILTLYLGSFDPKHQNSVHKIEKKLKKC